MTEPERDIPTETNGQGRHVPVEDLDAAPPEPQGTAASPPAAEEASLLEKYQRVCADYQNYQRRAAREMSQLRVSAAADVLAALLPVLDDLDRGIAHAEQEDGEPHPMLEGVRLIRDKFADVLKKHNVTAIPALGERFDPAVHEALMAEPREDVEPQTVIEVFQTGYRLGPRTLRPAKVKVSAAPPPAE